MGVMIRIALGCPRLNELMPVLDLRRTKCPLNFVQARLAAEKLQAGEVLEIWLAAGSESELNVPNSLRQEGYSVVLLPLAGGDNGDEDPDKLCCHVSRQGAN